MMTDCQAIHLDLNPMSTFLVESLCTPVNMNLLGEAFQRIKSSFEKHCPETDEEIERAMLKYPYPKGFKLPKGSDVNTIEELFSTKQLAQLAYLKYLIKREKEVAVRETLLLDLLHSYKSVAYVKI